MSEQKRGFWSTEEELCKRTWDAARQPTAERTPVTGIEGTAEDKAELYWHSHIVERQENHQQSSEPSGNAQSPVHSVSADQKTATKCEPTGRRGSEANLLQADRQPASPRYWNYEALPCIKCGGIHDGGCQPAPPQPEAEREKLAHWMTENSFATGHGDTLEDLLKELTWQVKEVRERGWQSAIEAAVIDAIRSLRPSPAPQEGEK